jgi:hypothetical protein
LICCLIRQQVVDLALERTELSSRELACHFTDERHYFPWQLEQDPSRVLWKLKMA